MTTLTAHYQMYADNPLRTQPRRMVPVTAETAREWGLPSYDPAVYLSLNLTWVDSVYGDYISLRNLAARERLYALAYASHVRHAARGDERLVRFMQNGPLEGRYYPAYLPGLICDAAASLGWNAPGERMAVMWAFGLEIVEMWRLPINHGCNCVECTERALSTDARWRVAFATPEEDEQDVEDEDEDEDDDYDEDAREALQLQSYSPLAEELPSRFKIRPREMATSKTLFMGFELEVDVPDNDTLNILKNTVKANVRRDAVGLFAYDGSLNEETGAEFKSIPASLSWHETSSEIKGLFRELSWSCEISSPDNMGLHIHVGRSALSRALIAKLLVFMNDGRNQEFLEGVARRKFNNWATRSSRYANIRYSVTNTYGGGKYSVLNVSKYRTIEFRLFASTTDYSEWAGSMQFVSALIRWCSERPMSDAFQATDFKAWVLDHSGAYPDLVSLMYSKETRREAIVSQRSKKRKKGTKPCV